MTALAPGTVLFGDVVDSRRDPGSSAWLRSLCAELEAAYPRDAPPRARSASPRATSSRGCSRRAPTRSSRSCARRCIPMRASCAGRSSPARC